MYQRVRTYSSMMTRIIEDTFPTPFLCESGLEIEIFFIQKALVSISHLREYAVAAVILEGENKQKPTSLKSD